MQGRTKVGHGFFEVCKVHVGGEVALSWAEEWADLLVLLESLLKLSISFISTKQDLRWTYSERVSMDVRGSIVND